MRIQFILSEIGIGLRRNLSIAISVMLVTMVSVYLMGIGFLAQGQVDTLKGYWYDRIQVSIFMCGKDSLDVNCDGKAVTDEQRDALRSQLDEMKPLVKNVYYESEQQAFDRFKEQYRNSPLSDYLQVGDIPQNFRVQLSDPKKYEVVVSAFEGAPGVGRVQDQQKTLDKLFKVMNVVTIGSLFLAGLMVLCSILLMATTIRQAAFSRRRETGIMKLVGASNFTIRLPFVMETVLAALTGTGLAIAGLWVTADSLLPRVSAVLQDAPLVGAHDIWFVAPWLVGFMLVVSVLTSWATLRRYLRV
ncbi:MULTISPECIES: permease-like cell division protein FtsX [unclassified Phycicoccus]|uniref:permease-like cell division protein FtsX n=1 Tax=unclassified Phycicoccus TaxID=2637926 RepID=UPI000703634D|nr:MULTISPECIES: permease-like cell division protein FtsX [unclassified Phycicoccus]KRF22993.1 cell division protein [Phycicoccus sp. Soil802]KRF24278.1 cell division protein [Phycicoccus sp. Soil803]